MPDYGHEMRGGAFITPSARDAAGTVRLATTAEDAGLDVVAFQDHPYQPAFLDAWTLLSWVGARTSRVHLMPDVANLPLRPPAVLARSAASLDLLTGGRVELGLGAGAFWDAIVAMGGPRLSPGDAVDALGEAIDVIRELWDPTRRLVRAGGEHHHLDGAKPGPAPAHRVPIWIGAVRPRMLRLTGRLGDGWVPSSAYLPPSDLAAPNVVIDDAARAAGRDPADVRRLYNIGGDFSPGAGFLRGPAPVWAEQLAEVALTHGMSTFIVAADTEDDIRRFGHEVMPDLRERVADERVRR